VGRDSFDGGALMARIDDGRAWNPFGQGPREVACSLPGERRDELVLGLLVAEAEEVAHGCRHLTIVHGDPMDVDGALLLAAFYETLRCLAGEHEWVRVRGDATFVTVTTRGVRAVEDLAMFEAAAAMANPGGWTITASAVPVSS
jgi:hypothetical protein